MIRAVLGLARMDLLVWVRSPWTIAASVLPVIGMAIVLTVLTVSVGQQPVALVVLDPGPLAARLATIMEGDRDAYLLSELDQRQASRALADQRVAAVIVIPSDFDQEVAKGDAQVHVYLNNVDIDFSDDIRRAVGRSVAEFDAPQLGLLGELNGPSQGATLPNPYRVAVAEHDLRTTSVDFLRYQVVAVLVLAVITVGTLGTASLAARDFERSTARVLLLSPRPLLALVAGRLLGGCAATGLVLVVLLALGLPLGAVAPPAGHWPALALLLALVTLMAVSLGLAVGTAIRSSRLVTMVSLNLATYLFFLGGGFTTVAFLPGWLQRLSLAVPTSYAISGLRQTLFYPDLTGVGVDLAALGAAAAIACLAAAGVVRAGWWRA